MPNARRKFVLLLTEGPSDVTALYRPLKDLFNAIDPSLILKPLFPQNNRCHDLTSEPLESVEKIAGVISSAFIHDFLEQNALLPKDIVRIIQIVDLDGAFIPNANICKGQERIYYGDSAIYTPHVDRIRERNRYKRSNLNYLSKRKRLPVFRKGSSASDKRDKDSDIRDKGYSIYYFSSNLDHFLFGSANLPPEEKIPRARAFSEMCQTNPEHFIDVFTRHDEEISGLSYNESWDYIKEGLNSLQPHSNLGVLVDELLREKRKQSKT